MIRFESDNSPIMRVVRRPVETQFSWSGALRLSLPDRVLEGNGSVFADASTIHGRIDDVPTHLLLKNETHDVSDILGSSPGLIVGESRRGEATSADNSWRGEHAILIGSSLGPSVSAAQFSIGSLITGTGRNTKDIRFERFVYQGGSLNFTSVMTDFPSESGIRFQRDRISGRFRGRRIEVRNLTDSSDPSQSFIGVTTEAPALTTIEADALWLLISFFNGARVKPVYRDTFDGDAEVIERRHRLGIPYGSNRVPPFDYRTATPSQNALEIIGNGFVRMMESDFPIAMIIHHVHDATTNNPETDTTFLLFAIHTAFEAWSRMANKQSLVAPELWRSRYSAIERAVTAQADGLPDELRSSILNRLRGANQTSMGFRERFLFDSIGIALDSEDKRTLRMRNELFHNGHLRARFHELDEGGRQWRIDMPRRLRNLVNQVVLKLVGYDGYVDEALRHGQLRITPFPDSPFIAHA
jgi:hypothetical protein